MSDKNIYQRLQDITAEAQVVDKKGWNDHGKYHYLRAQDVIESARELMCKHGVYASVDQENLFRERYITEVANRTKISYHSQVTIAVTFVNIDNPDEKVKVKASGAAADVLDKDSYKAITNTLKYIYINMFKFPVELDDIESNNPLESNRTKKSGNQFL